MSSEASFDVQLVVCMGCAWVSVRSFLGFVFGGNRFLQCNDAKVFFVFLLRFFFCFASYRRPYDVFDDKNMKFTA